jgi:hypothetical protein
VGNFLLRRFVKRMDKEPVSQSDLTQTSEKLGSIQVSEVLQSWGMRANAQMQIAGPIHPTILAILEQYQSIGPDKYFMPVDRQYANRPFSENSEYVQIGVWGDGSEVLAKRNPSDSQIYLAEIEDANPNRPSTLANTIEEFLIKAWDYHQDSLRQK